MLPARDVDRGEDGLLRLRGVRCTLREQQFAVQPIHLGLTVAFADSFESVAASKGMKIANPTTGDI
jgi:hypothetical protein